MKNIFTVAALLSVFFIGCKKDDNAPFALNPTEGNILLAPYSNNGVGDLMLVDRSGNTLWTRTLPNAAINFKKWVVNGKTRYSYEMLDTAAQRQIFASQGILPGRVFVLDENFNQLSTVNLLPFNGRTASDPNFVDAHEFIFLDDNHYITLTYYQKAVNNIPASLNPVANCKVVAPIIQEVNNGQVVWEWDGAAFPEFYQQSVEGNAFSNANVLHDYMHMNSLFVDPTDNNIICSIRNLNQIIKISRTDGHIVWRLGGTNSDFPMTAEMKFLRQHFATLTDNNQTLLLYDNGEATERPFTRVLEFRLSQEARTINSFKAFTLPDGIFSQFMGSVQKRGDTYFIGCGSVAKMLEVNYNTNKITFLMNLPSVSYRALKY